MAGMRYFISFCYTADDGMHIQNATLPMNKPPVRMDDVEYIQNEIARVFNRKNVLVMSWQPLPEEPVEKQVHARWRAEIEI